MNIRPLHSVVYVSLPLICVILRAASRLRYGLNLRHDRYSEAVLRGNGLGLIHVCKTGPWQGKKGWPLLFRC